MDCLEESLEILHTENELEKEEILRLLDQMLQSGSANNQILGTSPSKYTHTSELCKYEQKIHHKFTEIRFELQKFIALNKPPKCKIEEERKQYDIDPQDIENLKANSMILINKMDEYISKNKTSRESYSVGATPTERVDNFNMKYPYVSQSTLDELSDHTKEMLRDIKVNMTDHFHNTQQCAHFPEIKEKLPGISKSCSRNFKVCNTSTLTEDDICGHFPELEQRWPEISQICPIVTKSESVCSTGSSTTTTVKADFDSFQPQEKEVNFLEDTFLDFPISETRSQSKIDSPISNETNTFETLDQSNNLSEIENFLISSKGNIDNNNVMKIEATKENPVEVNSNNYNSLLVTSHNLIEEYELVIQEIQTYKTELDSVNEPDSMIEERQEIRTYETVSDATNQAESLTEERQVILEIQTHTDLDAVNETESLIEERQVILEIEAYSTDVDLDNKTESLIEERQVSQEIQPHKTDLDRVNGTESLIEERQVILDIETYNTNVDAVKQTESLNKERQVNQEIEPLNVDLDRVNGSESLIEERQVILEIETYNTNVDAAKKTESLIEERQVVQEIQPHKTDLDRVNGSESLFDVDADKKTESLIEEKQVIQEIQPHKIDLDRVNGTESLMEQRQVIPKIETYITNVYEVKKTESLIEERQVQEIQRYDSELKVVHEMDSVIQEIYNEAKPVIEQQIIDINVNEYEPNFEIKEEIDRNTTDIIEEKHIVEKQETDTRQNISNEIKVKTENIQQHIETDGVSIEASNDDLQLEKMPESISSSSSNFKLNNEVNEDSSAISESEGEKLSENDNGYCVEYDTDLNSPEKKKKKAKHHKEVFDKSTNGRKTKSLKQTPKFQDNLGADYTQYTTYDEYSSDGGPTEKTDVAVNKDVKDCNLSANVKQPCSLEEKLKKLGLEDDRTRFEKTRRVAPLPDLKLQPSVTDNEKMKQIQNQTNKFEICDRNVPSIYDICIFSHVESPIEFYIHLDDEESKLIDRLNETITEYFAKSKTLYKSKFEAFERIGKFCCAYVKKDKMYYRAEVIDWYFERSSKIVLVQLIDYGNYIPVHFKHLRELTNDFTLIPKIAVKCFLPLLYPPGSTKTKLLEEWPSSSTQALIDLSGLAQGGIKKFFKLVFVEKTEDFISVDMYDMGDPQLHTVGELLINLGHVVEIILPEDDPSGVMRDNEDIQRLETCNNLNEVVLGYDPRDEARICKFTRRDGTCFKGKNCKFEHVLWDRGGYTTDHLLTYSCALNEMKLPESGERIQIRFTNFLGATHYYINIMTFANSLVQLEQVINEPKVYSKFEPYKIMPAYGEIVLAKHWTKRWLRAKVRHHSYDDEGNCTVVQVFMVDYGDIIDVSLKNIKHIRPEFLELPFQAVECILHNYKAKNDVNLEEMDKFFYKNIALRSFTAQVLAVSDMMLCLAVYHKGENIGDILTQQGFLSKVNKRVWFPSDRSLVHPA